MPLQGILSRPAMAKVDKLAESGQEGGKEIASYFVGQCVGLMNEQQSTRSVVYEFMRDYAEAVERVSNTLGNSESPFVRNGFRPQTGHGMLASLSLRKGLGNGVAACRHFENG